MQPIDLVDYTNTSQKIPSFVLNPSFGEKKIKNFEILAASLIDGSVIFLSTLFYSQLIQVSIQNYMVTESLEMAFLNIDFSTIILGSIPIVTFFYYFFSFFFNQGQTWGMKLMKNRLEMKQLCFSSSFKWAIFSSLTTMSWGFLLLVSRKWFESHGWDKFKNHDHLYSKLIGHKDKAPIELIQRVQEMEEMASQYQEKQLEAA